MQHFTKADILPTFNYKKKLYLTVHQKWKNSAIHNGGVQVVARLPQRLKIFLLSADISGP